MANFRVHFTRADNEYTDVFTQDVTANNPQEAATIVRKGNPGCIITKTKVLKESITEEA